MKEIKFRGWFPHPLDPTKSKWVYGFFYIDSVDRYWIKCDVNSWRICRGSEGQFAGLTDKNAKKMFEGDIAKNDVTKYEVMFKNGAFRGKRLDYDYSDDFNHTELYDIVGLEIIGNKTENPELLEN